MGYNGTTGLTLCSLSLSLFLPWKRQEETNASGTLIVLTCRFGLFERAGVVAFRNSVYGPRYEHVSRRYGAVAIPWLSSRKRRVSNPLMKLTPGSRYRGRCNPRWPSRAGKLLVDESKQRVGNNGIVRHGGRGGCNSWNWDTRSSPRSLRHVAEDRAKRLSSFSPILEHRG